MSRSIPFEPDQICDGCGEPGAFDLMGDYLCPTCNVVTQIMDNQITMSRGAEILNISVEEMRKTIQEYTK